MNYKKPYLCPINDQTSGAAPGGRGLGIAPTHQVRISKKFNIVKKKIINKKHIILSTIIDTYKYLDDGMYLLSILCIL
jgi:hypothetical protein